MDPGVLSQCCCHWQIAWKKTLSTRLPKFSQGTIRAGYPRRMERVICFRYSRADLADVLLIAWVSHITAWRPPAQLHPPCFLPPIRPPSLHPHHLPAILAS